MLSICKYGRANIINICIQIIDNCFTVRRDVKNSYELFSNLSLVQHFDICFGNTIQVHKQWPSDVPHIGFHECAEMSHNYFGSDGYGTPFSDKDFSGHQSLMRRAYYGCLSYADALMGKALAMLENGGAAQDTIVTFIGGLVS